VLLWAVVGLFFGSMWTLLPIGDTLAGFLVLGTVLAAVLVALAKPDVHPYRSFVSWYDRSPRTSGHRGYGRWLRAHPVAAIPVRAVGFTIGLVLIDLVLGSNPVSPSDVIRAAGYGTVAALVLAAVESARRSDR
jgi:hypothetical protein